MKRIKDQIYQLKYLVIPDFLYKLDLTGIQLKVVAFIYSYNGDKFFFSNKKIAKMFNCSERSITRAIEEIEKMGLIKTHYEPKAGGGTIRFITRLDKIGESDWTGLSSRTRQDCLPKDNKIKDNKIKDIYNQQQAAEGDKNFSVRSNNFSSIKESLEKKSIPSPTKNKTIYPWQDEAVRFWSHLGLEGKPSSSWFKLFKKAHLANQRGLLLSAFGTTADADVIDKEKYFYKVFSSKLCKS